MHWTALHPHTTLTDVLIWIVVLFAVIAWSETRMSGQTAAAVTQKSAPLNSNLIPGGGGGGTAS